MTASIQNYVYIFLFINIFNNVDQERVLSYFIANAFDQIL